MGAAGVGKSCIISQFLYDTYTAKYHATVEELHRKEYEVNGNNLTLDILDTSGANEFPAMRQLSISKGNGFILMQSVDNEESFEEVKRLREQILNQRNDDSIPIVIVGNKSDCEKDRVVARESIETMVTLDWNNGFVEASVKDKNVMPIFQELFNQANVSYPLGQAMRRRQKSQWKRKNHNSCSIC